jgi:uncharacterized protein YidB (DUF937 family)
VLEGDLTEVNRRTHAPRFCRLSSFASRSTMSLDDLIAEHERPSPKKGPGELEPSSESGRCLQSTEKEHQMSRGFPSMTALLGLLAVAGYQNRDKLAELLRGMSSKPSAPGQPQEQGGFGELLENVRGSVDSLLGGGLSDLVDRFKQNGQGEVADSWVRQGPNQQVTPQQLEQAIGPDVLATLSQQTGLSREELLSRLSRNLPEAVDKYTPDGRIPAGAESARS